MMAGRKHRASGKRIFTGTLAAFSRARWRRLSRISSACACSTRPIGRPSASACDKHDGEGHEVVDVGAQLHVLQRVVAREPELHLPQREPQLVADR